MTFQVFQTARGVQVVQSPTGPPGPAGWAPVLALVADGARRVLYVSDWTGGGGPKPAIGYLAQSGLVATAAEAEDVGAAGLVALVGQDGASAASPGNPVPATVSGAATSAAQDQNTAVLQAFAAATLGAISGLATAAGQATALQMAGEIQQLLAAPLPLPSGAASQATLAAVLAALLAPTPTADNRFRLSAAATTNATLVRAGPTRLIGGAALNLSTANTYRLKLFDKAAAPVIGTDTPVLTLTLPKAMGAALPLAGIVSGFGAAFTAGLALAVTQLYADGDATPVAAAGDVELDLIYL